LLIGTRNQTKDEDRNLREAGAKLSDEFRTGDAGHSVPSDDEGEIASEFIRLNETECFGGVYRTEDGRCTALQQRLPHGGTQRIVINQQN
jgi:hypothetical protein